MAYRSRVFIDKISFTYPVASSDHSRVLNTAQGMAANGQLVPKRWSSGLMKSYSAAFSLELGAGENLIIQMAPWEGVRIETHATARRRRFLRFEWNPSKASLANEIAIARIGDVLGQLIPGFSPAGWHEEMHVTRIDLAFDLYEVAMDGICVSSLLRRAFSGIYVHHEFGSEGKRTAIEIGRADSDCYLRVYDKSQESQHRENGGLNRPAAGRPDASRVIRRTRSHVRFELQLRDVGPLARLGSMPNPFERFTVRTLAAMRLPEAKNDHIFGWFLDSCKLRGMQAALSTIANQRTRSAFRHLVCEAHPPLWWNSQLLWQEVPGAIGEAFRLAE